MRVMGRLEYLQGDVTFPTLSVSIQHVICVSVIIFAIGGAFQSRLPPREGSAMTSKCMGNRSGNYFVTTFLVFISPTRNFTAFQVSSLFRSLSLKQWGPNHCYIFTHAPRVRAMSMSQQKMRYSSCPDSLRSPPPDFEFDATFGAQDNTFPKDDVCRSSLPAPLLSVEL